MGGTERESLFRLIRMSEFAVRPALPRPVAHLLCDRKALYSIALEKGPANLIRFQGSHTGGIAWAGEPGRESKLPRTSGP